MLMTMTATGADGGSTRFEQRMEVPAHGFLDVAATLDRDGMRQCLRGHLSAGRLRSAMAQAAGFALPWLMQGIADGATGRKDTTFDVHGTRVAVSVGT